MTEQEKRLIDAVLNFDMKTAEEGLASGEANSNAKDPKSGLSILMIASGLGRVPMVSLLLRYQADVNVLDNKYGYTALHKAAQKGSTEVARLLLEQGAFLDLQSPANGHTPLIDAIWYKNVEIAKFFLINGANLNVVTKYGFDLNEFIDFALKVNKEGQEELLEIKAAVEKRRKQDQETIESQKLMKAVRAGNLQSVKQLIKEGCDVDQRYPAVNSFDDDYTPLLVACRDNHPDIVKELLNAGADVRAHDYIFHGEPIHKAAYMGNPEVAKILVESSKIDIDVMGDMNGYTPLHDALWHGNTEVAWILIKAKAKMDIKAHDGLSALDIAVKIYGKNHEIVKAIESEINESAKEGTGV